MLQWFSIVSDSNGILYIISMLVFKMTNQVMPSKSGGYGLHNPLDLYSPILSSQRDSTLEDRIEVQS